MNLASLQHLLAKYLRVFRYGTRMRPLRDWLFVTLIAFVLLFISAGWSYLLFTRISGEDVGGTATAASSEQGIASLDTVLSVFSARAIERTHYLSDYHFVDPSK